jgi:hypothetical protein
MPANPLPVSSRTMIRRLLGRKLGKDPEPSPSLADSSGDGPDPNQIRARLGEVAAVLGLTSPPEPAAQTPDAGFRPLISVLVPVFNDARFVEETLESVRRQTYTHWECVVVDDASSDDSWALIEKVTGDDDRFKTIRNQGNLGPGAARNVAIAIARGEYLAFLDGDDLLLRESLGDRVAALAARLDDPFVVGSFCGVRFSPENTTLGSLADRYRSDQPPFVDFVVADGEVPFPMTAPLVATGRVRSVGGLDEKMVTGGVDWDLWYRMLRNGHVFVSTPYQGVIYRQRAGGITRGNPAAHTAAAAQLIRAAHDREDRVILADPSPYTMLEPLGTYRAHLAVARRAVRFAAMALVDGDRAGMEASISVVAAGTWPLLQRHLDLSSLVVRGAARALGVKPDQLDDDAAEALAPFVTEVSFALRKASS